MDFIKILMIICVSMGVTMAFKTLRVSTDSEPIRNTWDLLELNEETTEDKPDFRRNPSYKTSSIAVDAAEDTFEQPCPSETVHVQLDNITHGAILLVPDVEYRFTYETICKKPNDSDQRDVINDVWYKVCDTSGPRTGYCYQVEKSVAIQYTKHLLRGRRRVLGKQTKTIKIKAGCSCGKQILGRK